MNREELRARAWTALGLERDAEGLTDLLSYLDTARRDDQEDPADRVAAETGNLADVARAMALSALFREESRGAHFRTDFPETDDVRFHGHTLLEAGRTRLADTECPVAVETRC